VYVHSTLHAVQYPYQVTTDAPPHITRSGGGWIWSGVGCITGCSRDACILCNTTCSAIHSSVYSTHRAHVCALLHCIWYVSIPVCIPLYQRSCTHPGPQHLHLQDPAREQTWKCTSEVCLAHESTMHIMIRDMI